MDSNELLREALEVAASNFDFDGDYQKAEATRKLVNEFASGVRYALDYLSDLYEGIEETSLWAEFMNEKENA